MKKINKKQANKESASNMDEGRVYIEDNHECGVSHRVAGWYTSKDSPKIWGNDEGFKMFSDTALYADKDNLIKLKK
jgi:hypothetical protein